MRSTPSAGASAATWRARRSASPRMRSRSPNTARSSATATPLRNGASSLPPAASAGAMIGLPTVRLQRHSIMKERPVGHHRPRRRHHDAGHSYVRGLQREVTDGARVGDVARGAPADVDFARPRDRLVHRHRHCDSPRRAIRLQHRDGPGAPFHPHVGGGVDGLALEAFDVAWDPQHPVGIHTPQIRPHQGLRPLIGHGRRNARRLEQRAREALEIGARNHVHFKLRWHTGSPQQLRRRRISRGRSLYERARQATIPRALNACTAGFAQWSACLTAQRTALCSRARQRSPCDPGGRNMHETKRAVLVGLIAASFAWAGAAAQEIKLTLADQNSPTGWGPSHALQPWVKQVEDATKGRVKIEVYPSQTLIKGVDMWKGIRGGIADIGWCVQGYWPEQTPLSDVVSLPFLPISSAEKGSEALWKLYEKFPSVQKEYSEIEPLLLYTSSPNLLVSKRQVKTLDEFKGLKFRVLGGPPTEMAKALGAVPTLIPMPDVYQSLDKGVVDGAAAPWEAIQAFRLYEVAKNFTIAPF